MTAQINTSDTFFDASSVPTTFGPAFEVAGTLPDLTLVTADGIVFHVHLRLLLHTSTNMFGGLLQGYPTSIHLPEYSAEIAILLHIAYGLSCLHLFSALTSVEKAVDALIKYGFPVQSLAVPSMPLYHLILSHAPHQPIEAYAVAGHYDLEELAVAISSHLLAYDTSKLSDELSIKMGSVYCKRLFDLHQLRRDALKSIIMRPPEAHRPNLACGTAAQSQLTIAWAHAAAELVWATGNLSTYALQSAFEKAGRGISCGECMSMLQKRIQEMMLEWSAVQKTI